MSDVNIRKNANWTELNVTLDNSEATQTQKGIVRLATKEEVDEAVVADAAISPLTAAKGMPGGVAILDEGTKVPFDNMPIVVSDRLPTTADTDDVLWVATGNAAATEIKPVDVIVTLVSETETYAMYKGTISPPNATNTMIMWSDGQISLSNGSVTVDKKASEFELTAYSYANNDVSKTVTVKANPWLAAKITIDKKTETPESVSIQITLSSTSGEISQNTIILSTGQTCTSGDTISIQKQQFMYTIIASAQSYPSVTAMYIVDSNPYLAAEIDIRVQSEDGGSITYVGTIKPDTVPNKNIKWKYYINGSLTTASTVSGQSLTILKSPQESSITATSAGDSDVKTTLTVPKQGYGQSVPPGTILPFHNVAINNRHPVFWGQQIADPGWLVCDGGSDLSGGYVPNLVDKFIMGASAAEGGGKTGGVKEITLTTNNIPRHNHAITVSGSTAASGAHTHQYYDIYHTEAGGSVTVPSNFGCDGSDNDNRGYQLSRTTGSAGSHSHTMSLSATSGYVGSGEKFSIINPYYTLIYCVKLK